MQVEATYSYRHAVAILENEYSTERQEILNSIAAVSWHPKAQPTIRTRQGRQVANLTIDQIATNAAFEEQFRQRSWLIRPRIVSQSESQLAADFKKGSIQVEIQFGNMARWYTDIFKFLLSYSANDIEIGVLIVPMLSVAVKIDENVVNYERVTRELPHAKMAVTIPVWVIGLGDNPQ